MSNAAWAKEYIRRYGVSLVYIEPNQKHTTREGWGENTIDTVEQAEEFYTKNPDWGIAFELGKSKLVSLDIDCDESFQLLLEEFGLDYSELDKYPTIKGASKGKRVVFKEPEGVQLPYHKLNWPRKDDPTKKYTVFELRAAAGKHRLDMAPPSVHKDTGKPYTWLVPCPADGEPWPEPPAWLLAVWGAWESLGVQFKNACPWLPEEVKPVYTRPSAPRVAGDNTANDLVDEFNRQHPLRTMLDTYGYKQMGKRYLSPHSTTGLAGVHMLSEDKCWIHHASDPSCSDDSGQPVSSYDLFVENEHRGNKSEAFKDAAKLLGVKLGGNIYTPPPVESKQPPSEELPQFNGISPDDHHEMDIDFDPFVFLGDEEINKNAPILKRDPTPIPIDDGFVDEKTLLPYANGKGKPLNHAENLREICRRLGVVVRYNIIKKTEEIIIPRQGFTVDNSAVASVAWLISNCSIFDMSTSNVNHYLTLIADSNQHNPVVEWIKSKPWDGVGRFKDLCDTVTVVGNNDLKETLIKRWMISAICGAFNPLGVSAQGVLVMQGDQGLGKTTWFKSLVPSTLDVIKEGMILKMDKPDSIKQVISNWLVELGELDGTFNKSDASALKSFITNDRDIIRQPYASRSNEFIRRTVFFGSVNPRGFLKDETGNRRYWTLEVTDLNSMHNIDVQQMWCEMYHMWRGGETHFLNREEEQLLATSNEEFMSVDPIESSIAESFRWDSDESKWTWGTITEIMRKAGYDKITKGEARTAGNVIRKLNGKKEKRSSSNKVFFYPQCVTPLDRFNP